MRQTTFGLLIFFLPTGAFGQGAPVEEKALASEMAAAHRAIEQRAYGKALVHLEKALKLKSDPTVSFLRARTARRAGELDKAQRYLEHCRRLEAPGNDITLEENLLAFQRGDWNESEPFLQTSVKKRHADAPLILEVLVKEYKEAYHFKKALASSEQWVKLQPQQVQAWLTRGEMAELLEDPESAQAAYREAVKLAPKDVDSRLRLAKVLLAYRRLDEVLESLQELCKQQPDNPEILLALGRCYHVMGQLGKAQAILRELSAKHPKDTRPLVELAHIATAEEKLAEADSLLRKALTLDRHDPQLFYIFQYNLLRLGKRDELRQWQPKIKRSMADARRLKNLYREIIEPQEISGWGAPLQRKAIRLGNGPPPGTPAQHAEIGAILLRSGRVSEGIRWLQRSLQKGPQPPPVQEALYVAIKDPDLRTRFYGAAALGKLKPNDKVVVSVLLESLREKDAELRRLAADALGEVRPADQAVPEALSAAARDPDEAVAQSAAKALARFPMK